MAINKNMINQNNQYYVSNPKINRQWSALKITETNQTSGDMGYLIPIWERELIPGEKIRINQDIAIQTQPTKTNLMHEIYGETMFFAVPHRLMHPQWEEFITGGKDGQTTVENIYVPWDKIAENRKTCQQTLENTLWDMFGYAIPKKTWWEDTTDSTVFADEGSISQYQYESIAPNSYKHRAYNLIYNDVLRYPDIDDEVDIDQNQILRGYWQSDYFTRARIYQQRGQAPTIPANVNLTTELNHVFAQSNMPPNAENITIGVKRYADGEYQQTETEYSEAGPSPYLVEVNPGQGTKQVYLEPHKLKLSDENSGITINLNDVVTGMAILRYQVNNARIQPRYCDQLKVRFGVYPEDARLQRPEYLGSNTFNIGINTVTNTATDQGHISGQGWGTDNGKAIEYEAKEHVWLMAIMIVRPATVYEGTMSKMFRRETRFDYPTPELANIPDVPVKGENIAWGLNMGRIGNQEAATPEYQKETFGYQDVYEENRTALNKVCGLMRPSIDGNLATYNLARFFTYDNLPNLNAQFLKCVPDDERIKMYTEQPFMTSIFVRTHYRTALPLPIQSEPAEQQAL